MSFLHKAHEFGRAATDKQTVKSSRVWLRELALANHSAPDRASHRLPAHLLPSLSPPIARRPPPASPSPAAPSCRAAGRSARSHPPGRRGVRSETPAARRESRRATVRRAGTYRPSSAMRPRIDCARTALSPRAANGWRATKARRSRMRRSEERADAGLDLPALLGPADRLPLQHEVAERLDPLVRRRLLAPQVEQVHAALRVEADHHMHGVVAAAGAHRVIGGAVGAQGPAESVRRRAASRP